MPRIKKEKISTPETTSKEDVDVSSIIENKIIVEEVEKSLEEKTDNGIVAVIGRGNKIVRTYTLEIHGKEYKKLAEEFAKKKGLNIK
jgi:hypothetical protein